jgi:hypothetical protein
MTERQNEEDGNKQRNKKLKKNEAGNKGRKRLKEERKYI